MTETKDLQGSGDFCSEECLELLKQADVVVTNPPFSLFREYVAQLMQYNKKFIIIGDKNCITYKEVFPYIKENKLFIGVKPMSGSLWFPTPASHHSKHNKMFNGKMMSPIACCWFTNIEHKKRNTPIDLYKKYNPTDYPKYDNYDAINVDKTSDIPLDYEGIMGVPISFLDKYCPTQFEIIDARTVALNDRQKNKSTFLIKDADSAINGKPTYARIAIKKI